MASTFIKGIIGDGFLTEIILTAFMRQIGITPNDTYVLSETSGRCQELLEQYNVHAVQNPMIFVPPAQLIVLACEIEKSEELMKEIADKMARDVLIISVIPGLKLDVIEKYFKNNMVIRLIMNPWVVNGYGVSTYIVGSNRSEEAGNIARAILTSLGETIEVKSENELEIVGDLILSESVYSFLSVKALVNSGTKAGLSIDKSKEIVMKILSSNSDEVTESVVHRSYKQSNYMEKGRELLEKYKIIDNFKKSFEAPLEEKDIFKLRYRW